jgi:hypothetical protein
VQQPGQRPGPPIVLVIVRVAVIMGVIVVPARRFVHGNQHARQNALQHIDNCQAHSPAKDTQQHVLIAARFAGYWRRVAPDKTMCR